MIDKQFGAYNDKVTLIADGNRGIGLVACRNLFSHAQDQPWRAEGSFWYLYNPRVPEKIEKHRAAAIVIVLLHYLLLIVHNVYHLHTANQIKDDVNMALLRAELLHFASRYFPLWPFYEDFYREPRQLSNALCDGLSIDSMKHRLEHVGSTANYGKARLASEHAYDLASYSLEKAMLIYRLVGEAVAWRNS